MKYLYRIDGQVLVCDIIGRLNRFVVKVSWGSRDRESYAYINNTGRLHDYIARDRIGYCIQKHSGRIPYRLFAVADGEYAALIDTFFQMKAFEYSVSEGYIPWLRECRIVKRNPRLNKSVLDYLMLCRNNRVYVEVKSAVLRGDSIYAMYPDRPSIRGRRHIRDLIKLVEEGGIAEIVFIAGLPGVKAFKPYSEGDPVIHSLLKEAIAKGVIVKAISLFYDPSANYIVLDNPDLPVYI